MIDVFITTIGAAGLVVIAYLLFYTYKLWSFRLHTALIKRRLNISFLQIWSIFVFFFMEVWWSFMSGGLLPISSKTEFINWIFWILSIQSTIWLSVLKFWLLYYDMRWSIAAHRKQWHRIINPKSIITTPITIPLSQARSPNSGDILPPKRVPFQTAISESATPIPTNIVIDHDTTDDEKYCPDPPIVGINLNLDLNASRQSAQSIQSIQSMQSSIQSIASLPSLASVNTVNTVSSGSRNDWGSGPVVTETRSHQRLLFWLRHKKTFGNFKFMFVICLIIIVLFSIGQSIPAYLISLDPENGETWYLIQAIVSTTSYVIAGIILSMLLYQIDYSLKFDDNFYIEMELKYLFIMLTGYFISVAVNTTVNMTGTGDATPYVSKDDHIIMVYYIYTVIKHACFYGIWILHSKWVLYKLRRILNDNTLFAKECNKNMSLNNMFKNFGNVSNTSTSIFYIGNNNYNSNNSRNRNSNNYKSRHKSTAREIEEGDKIIEPIISHHVQIEQEEKDKQQKNSNGKSARKFKEEKKNSTKQNKKKQQKKKNDKIRLNQILSHKKGIDLFMVHLARELSTECLLSIIEFIQFQNYVFQQTRLLYNGNNDDNDDGDNDNHDELKNVLNEMERELLQTKCNIKLPHTIPNSDAFDQELFDVTHNDINDQTTLILNSKKIAYKIYQKYVQVGADYEINVQSKTRKTLMRKMDNFEDWILNDQVDLLTLFHLFEQCFAEMVALLSGCLGRFRTSPAFKKFKMTYF